MKRLGDINFADLLPPSISADPTVAAAAETLNALLHKTTRAVPNLLLWARLNRPEAALIPPLARVTEAAGGLKPHTTDGLELLAWQLHVDFREVAKDDAALERMVLGSIPWHRLKGTPAAVEQGLEMFGITALCDESGTGHNWAVYELELAEVPTYRDLVNIVRVAEEAGPKRSWLRRVHNHYDIRPIVWDVGPPLDEGFWDDDSGVWHPELGIKESFGRTTGLMTEPSDGWRVGFGCLISRPIRAFYVDRAIWDLWTYDTPVTRNYGVSRLRLHAVQSQGIEGLRYFWTGPWDGRQWGAGFTAPQRRIHYKRQVSKAELVLDEAPLDDALKTYDRRVRTLVDKPLRFDEGAWDMGRDESGIRDVYIDELIIRRHGLSAGLENIQAGFAVTVAD